MLEGRRTRGTGNQGRISFEGFQDPEYQKGLCTQSLVRDQTSSPRRKKAELEEVSETVSEFKSSKNKPLPFITFLFLLAFFFFFFFNSNNSTSNQKWEEKIKQP